MIGWNNTICSNFLSHCNGFSANNHTKLVNCTINTFWLKIVIKDLLNTLVWLDPWWGWWNYRHHHLEQLQLCPKSKLDLDCLVLQQWNPRHKNWLQIYVYIPSYLLEGILISYFSLKMYNIVWKLKKESYKYFNTFFL